MALAAVQRATGDEVVLNAGYECRTCGGPRSREEFKAGACRHCDARCWAHGVRGEPLCRIISRRVTAARSSEGVRATWKRSEVTCSYCLIAADLCESKGCAPEIAYLMRARTGKTWKRWMGSPQTIAGTRAYLRRKGRRGALVFRESFFNLFSVNVRIAKEVQP